MSLILEALKKLEREKRAPEPGVVVLGATAWATPSEGRSRLWLVLLADLLLIGVGVGATLWWLRDQAVPPTVAAAPGASVSAPPAPVAPVALPSAVATAQLPTSTTSARRSTPITLPTASTSPKPRLSAPETFILQALTEQDGVPVALINERLLRVGEGFDGMRVLSIDATSVEIEIEATHERHLLAF